MRVQLPAGLRALAHRNFRLFMVGQGTSQIGNWVQLIATSWLVYKLSGSTLMLGLAAFGLQIPLLVVTPFAGVFIDRVDVRRVLYAANALASVQAALMLALLLSGGLEAWHLVAGNLVLGIANAFEAPARQSLLPRLLPNRGDLPNAIALNSTVMNGARFIGPMLGGVVTAAFGESWSFGVNCVLRGAVIAALAMTVLPPRAPAAASAGWASELAGGLRYAYGFLPSRCALLLLAATSFSLQSYSAMMPWFAHDRFHGDSRTLGLLMSCAGLGAVFGMLYLATRESVRGLLRLVGWSAAAASLALVAFSFCTRLWLALPLLFIASMGLMLTAAATNTVLQTIVPDALRGRVASLYVMSFIGMSPLGSLLTGWIALHVGTAHALALCGLLGLVCAGVYAAAFPAIRTAVAPVYEALQIPRRTTRQR